MKKTLSITGRDMEQIAESKDKLIFLGISKNFVYQNGKKTNIVDFIKISAISTKGSVTFFIPYSEEKFNKLQSSFKDKELDYVYVSDFGNVIDFKISVYNGELLIKFFLE